MNLFRVVPAVVVAVSLWALQATAESLPLPEGRVLLTVSGDIEMTNDGEAATFDLEMLRALGESEIKTDTIWTPGDHVFTGVRLKTLLDHLGAEGSTIEATAINDYSVTIPMSDATEGGPIVAYAMDGKELSRRDKGPLWVIYPFSSSSDYRTEVIYSRSIWQLDRITIKE
ncbi:Oxidoreductase molybdopterin binding domain protein [Roseovarius sp. THAF9]|uniref:molybdopterin-dependent oxidoreductase n=1 Tax=Roseovarius sp. THAF9 TaxID=2587847 RepID=UPI0012680466|nr:molybdopterin-dependent oxidoreductase [Roseovarius sp. THAF9]QFT94001.1 Oxidoreductase molybdopterin binding domain protein [Roseovarius sp. THAF9]